MAKSGAAYGVTQIETEEDAESDVTGSVATTCMRSVPSSSRLGVPLKVRLSGSNESHDEGEDAEYVRDAFVSDRKVLFENAQE